MAEIKTEEISLFDYYVPDEWLKSDNSQILFTAYRMINYGDYIPKIDNRFDFKDIRVAIHFGEITYHNFDEDWDFVETENKILCKLNENNKHKKGAWLFFFQPFIKDEEIRAKQLCSSFYGLYTSILGTTIAYKKEFQHVINSKGQTTFTSSVMLNPSILEKNIYKDEYFEYIHKLGTIIQNLEKKESQRILLSLHWFEKSMNSTGVDAFLNLWISLEALAMPDTTDISPLKKIISKIYNKGKQELEDFACLGKLFGLRSEIVHNGKIASINYNILEHTKGIYIDVLLEIVNARPIFMLELKKKRTEKDITELLKNALL